MLSAGSYSSWSHCWQFSDVVSSVCSGSQTSWWSVVPHSVGRGCWEHCLLLYKPLVACAALVSPLHLRKDVVKLEKVKTYEHLVWGGEGWGWRRVWGLPAQEGSGWGECTILLTKPWSATTMSHLVKAIASLKTGNRKNHVTRWGLNFWNLLPQEARSRQQIQKGVRHVDEWQVNNRTAKA